MKVYNLTSAIMVYRKKLIPPYGHDDFDISFIPDRDKALATSGVLAFGSLPKGWVRPKPKVFGAPAVEKKIEPIVEEVKERSYKDWKRRKH